MNLTLTALESRLLKAWIVNTCNDMGGESVEDVLADNFSWITATDLNELTKLPVPVIKGLLDSLTKKGLCAPEGGDHKDLLDLTDEGVKIAFSILEQ